MEQASETDSGAPRRSAFHSAARGDPAAQRKRRRELEARLEVCVQELRRLCLREAELTGILPREFPLQSGEKPPKVRRRIGAAFKLDETLVLRGADPLSTLERDLALQLQIAEAARRLCREENIGKQLRKRRKSAALKEERKLKELETTLNECRLRAGCRPLPTSGGTAADEPSASDDSSLSDAVLPEEAQPRPPAPRPRARPGDDASLHRACEEAEPLEADAGAEPVASPLPIPTAPGLADMSPYRLVPVRSLALCRRGGSSAPTTPELPARRGQSQSLRAQGCREPAEAGGRGALPRRRPTYYTVTAPARCSPAPGAGSDDSSSDVSSASRATSPGGGRSPVASRRRPPAAEPPAGSYTGGVRRLPAPAAYRGPDAVVSEQDAVPLRYQRLVPGRSRVARAPSLRDSAPPAGRLLSKAAVTQELMSWHERARLRAGARPRSLDRRDLLRPGGETYASRAPVAQTHVLQRCLDGAPRQVYVPENGEIVTRV
ncbi:innate immunity activator protein isoform X2 [Struthio camelus]